MTSSSTRSTGSASSRSSACQAVGSADRRVAEELELLLEQVDVERLVVDDQDARGAGHPRIPAQRRPAPSRIRPSFSNRSALVDRLGEVVVAAAGARLGLVALHRVRGQRDHRNVAERGVGLEPAGRLPAVDHRQRQVHQDQIGPQARRGLEPGGAVGGGHHLVVVLKKLHEQVAVQLHVFHDQDPRHRPIPSPPARRRRAAPGAPPAARSRGRGRASR